MAYFEWITFGVLSYYFSQRLFSSNPMQNFFLSSKASLAFTAKEFELFFISVWFNFDTSLILGN